MFDLVQHPASYRDPAGFVFYHNNSLYRQVNQSGKQDYELLMKSGLYHQLVQKNYLVSHTELNENLTATANWFITLQPRVIPFVSYAYEWSFDMMKEAALLTLAVNKIAIQYGMILKDATSFNIQFNGIAPVFIDTLSFEQYDPQKPWDAYRQFCQCFFFPLLLAAYTKTEWQRLLTVFPEGIPVKQVAALLPLKSRLNIHVWLHVFLQGKYASVQNQNDNKPAAHFSTQKMMHLMNGLEQCIQKLQPQYQQQWSNYYSSTIPGEGYLDEKKRIFLALFGKIKSNTVLDLGTNDGFFAQLVANSVSQVIAADYAPDCINNLYKNLKQSSSIQNILPLVVDIANPTPAIGLRNTERSSFLQRINVDTVLALALVHHLFFTHYYSLEKQAALFSELCGKYLVIEFIPLTDEKLTIIRNLKIANSDSYNVTIFETAFSAWFHPMEKQVLKNGRIIYLLKKQAHEVVVG